MIKTQRLWRELTFQAPSSSCWQNQIILSFYDLLHTLDVCESIGGENSLCTCVLLTGLRMMPFFILSIISSTAFAFMLDAGAAS